MTTHIVASFPPGTDHAAAERAGIAWAAEMFGDGAVAGERPYILGFHVDRGHPHVHVILNRRALSAGHEWLKLANRNERINYDLMRQRFADHAQIQGIDLLADARVPIPWSTQPFTREQHEVFADAAGVGVGVREEWEDRTEEIFRDDAVRRQQAGGGPGSSGGDGPGAGMGSDGGHSRRRRPRAEHAPGDAAGSSPKPAGTNAPTGSSHHSGSGGGSGSQGNALASEPAPLHATNGAPGYVEQDPSNDLYYATPTNSREPTPEERSTEGHSATGGSASGGSGGGSELLDNTIDASAGNSPRSGADSGAEQAKGEKRKRTGPHGTGDSKRRRGDDGRG
ncbi:relaxase/mobilization nuclease domain-containing protein [Neorhizobium sp. SHOUNA12A]|uniref:relaxase/mobilization nuclease domain-containing protein n=1 Tax=Neorhizobium sp. SHOUNA12A TaxID=2908923 RepID=UPI003862177A